MSEQIDFRVPIALFGSPAFTELAAELGDAGEACLFRLMAWTRVHRSNGDLTGLSDAALEVAAGWRGKRGRLPTTLRATGLIDAKGQLCDWSTTNGWAAGSASRSYRGRIGGLLKQCLRAGMEPSRYLSIQGGAIASDAGLLADLQRAFDAHRKNGKKGAPGGGLATAPKAGGDPTPPCPSPTPPPHPTPKEGGGGEGGSAPDLPPPGSVAAPPGVENGKPACTKCGLGPALSPESDPHGRCFSCHLEARAQRASLNGHAPATARPA